MKLCKAISWLITTDPHDEPSASGGSGSGLFCLAHRRTHGFSLVEAVICVFVVGLMIVTAMNTVGSSQKTQLANAQRSVALLLAQDLMDEIVLQAYEEPVAAPTFGRETGESATRRDLWDDVDDYNGWSANPPERQDGTAIPSMDIYQREVEVVWLNANDFSLVSGSESGIKRIRVMVKHGDRVLVTLTSLRTSGWSNPSSAN